VHRDELRTMKLALVLLAACGTTDPCAGHSTCVELDISARPGTSIDHIDQLEVDLLAGTFHSTVRTPAAPADTPVPLETAIAFDSDATSVGIVVAGMLTGTVLGTAATTVALGSGQHAKVVLLLATPVTCVAMSKYCGGDKVVGDADTLYECIDNAVPEARGTCTHGCLVNTSMNDGCAGGTGTCMDNAHYCGGHMLEGDPSDLYVCNNGSGIAPQPCPNGCADGGPAGIDTCR
jgi:hypothetical protein